MQQGATKVAGRTRRRWTLAVVAVVGGLGACSSDSSDGAATTSSAEAPGTADSAVGPDTALSVAALEGSWERADGGFPIVSCLVGGGSLDEAVSSCGVDAVDYVGELTIEGDAATLSTTDWECTAEVSVANEGDTIELVLGSVECNGEPASDLSFGVTIEDDGTIVLDGTPFAPTT